MSACPGCLDCRPASLLAGSIFDETPRCGGKETDVDEAHNAAYRRVSDAGTAYADAVAEFLDGGPNRTLTIAVGFQTSDGRLLKLVPAGPGLIHLTFDQ